MHILEKIQNHFGKPIKKLNPSDYEALEDNQSSYRGPYETSNSPFP